MSLYATWLSIDAEEHDGGCARWVPVPPTEHGGAPLSWNMVDNEGRYFRRDDDIGCTCGAGPIVYRGSGVFPSESDPHAGYLTLCAIPGFLTPDGRDRDAEADGSMHPWLRVCAGGDGEAVLLLHVAQVAVMYQVLEQWLDRVPGYGRGEDGQCAR